MKFYVTRTSLYNSHDSPDTTCVRCGDDAFGNPLWCVELESLQDLLDFSGGSQVIIYDPALYSWKKPQPEEFHVLEFYDDYRE